MRTLTRTLSSLAAVALLAGGLSACEGEPSAAQKSADARNEGVERIREKQPVSAMDYSQTLNTINRWAETWGQEGTVSYVYMKKSTGEVDGYYVMDGPPVNMCTSGSPTYDIVDSEGDGDDYPDREVAAPGLDGAYYGGCDSSRYYGFDAVTGQYLEYTDGFITTAMLSNQPIPQMSTNPYVSSVEDVEKQ